MDDKKILLSNIDKIHTTNMGIDRIKRNLDLDTSNVVDFCKSEISKLDSEVIRKGKNYYVTSNHCIITVNSYSFTIITAHKIKKT